MVYNFKFFIKPFGNDTQNIGIDSCVVNLGLSERSALPVGHLLDFTNWKIFWIWSENAFLETILHDELETRRVGQFLNFVVNILEVNKPFEHLESRPKRRVHQKFFDLEYISLKSKSNYNSGFENLC